MEDVTFEKSSHGTFLDPRGERPDLKWKSALLRLDPDGSWLAQFDDILLKEAFGWWKFEHDCFLLSPSTREIKKLARDICHSYMTEVDEGSGNLYWHFFGNDLKEAIDKNWRSWSAEAVAAYHDAASQVKAAP